MAVKQLHLADIGNATPATLVPAFRGVCVCLGGNPFANEPDHQGLSSNLHCLLAL